MQGGITSNCIVQDFCPTGDFYLERSVCYLLSKFVLRTAVMCDKTAQQASGAQWRIRRESRRLPINSATKVPQKKKKKSCHRKILLSTWHFHVKKKKERKKPVLKVHRLTMRAGKKGNTKPPYFKRMTAV